jgi:hypothetical protein
MNRKTLAIVTLAIAPVVWACPWEIHSTTADEIPAQTSVEAPLSAGGINDVPVIPWKLNYNSLKGTSPNSTINNLVSQINADVQEVWYDSNYAYIKITDVPSHSVGPFPDGNPSYPSNINKTLRITRTPAEATNKVSTGLGAIGVMVNGVYIYNASDAMSYNNAGVWYRNANVFEAGGFDSAPGHPSPLQGSSGNPRPGQYHYHQSPAALLGQVDAGNTGQHHSPLIGFAFDGFPIYGPYGYTDPASANSAIKRISSGYKVRDDVAAGTRTTLTDGGTVLSISQQGPAVSTSYPAGCFLQDWEYQSGYGDLNQYNMRFTVTPEYPNGTWAYFVTYDSAGKAAYPYIVGTQYFGVVDSANLSGTTIPTGASKLKVGDANLDNAVNSLDFNALVSGYGSYGLWTSGDFDRNGKVSTVDFNYLAANFGGSGGASLGVTVPEPTSAGHMLAGILILWRRVR